LKIEGRPARFLVALAFPFLKLWLATLRWKIEDRGNVFAIPATQRVIAGLWHNRLLLSAHVIQKFFPQRPGAALISASRDGALIADVVERYGFETARGSSSRFGSTALLQLADAIARGRDVLITPDGPRGPAYRLGGGILFLAQKAGVPIIPANFEYSAYWRAKSWDRFILPKPFSKVRFILGQPQTVRSTSTDEEFEAERVRIEKAMMALVEMR
jgi:lysophospholipid acyltransferase (LPLAT)-like uncharacterized protein